MTKAQRRRLDAAAREWRAARGVIAKVLRQWMSHDAALRYAASILAKLATHDPPIVVTFVNKDGEPCSLCVEVEG